MSTDDIDERCACCYFYKIKLCYPLLGCCEDPEVDEQYMADMDMFYTTKQGDVGQ